MRTQTRLQDIIQLAALAMALALKATGSIGDVVNSARVA